jgi:hypothetical protein
MEVQALSAGVVLEVQVFPSVLVEMRLPVPVLLTAANNESWLENATEVQVNFAIGTTALLLITLLPVPEFAIAANVLGLLVIAVQLLSTGLLERVQLIPLNEYITLFRVPEVATAWNIPRVPFQTTEVQSLLAALVRIVQAIPLGDVITLLPVPVFDTATKRVSSGDQAMLCQLLFAAEVRVDQVMPSVLVATLFLYPLLDTAANKLSSGDQATEVQFLAGIPVIAEVVITRLPVPLFDTAAKMPSCGDQQTLCQLLEVGCLNKFQAIPS